jgi:hypothetical protein
VLLRAGHRRTERLDAHPRGHPALREREGGDSAEGRGLETASRGAPSRMTPSPISLRDSEEEAPSEAAEPRATGSREHHYRYSTGRRELDRGFLDGDSEDVAEDHWTDLVSRALVDETVGVARRVTTL